MGLGDIAGEAALTAIAGNDGLGQDGSVRLLTRLHVFHSDGLPALYQPLRCCGQSAGRNAASRG